MSHTPGKWIVRKTVDESGDYPFPTYDVIALKEYGPEGVCCAYQNPHNARLIAAAPELLEALEAIVEAWFSEAPDSLEIFGKALDYAKVVIAKAKETIK